MSERTELPPPITDYAAARRQYVELYGSLAVMNTYLKTAVLALSAVALGLIVLNAKTYEAYHHLQPLVIRINDVGRADAVAYSSLAYQPQEAELKYFLVRFVQQHYARIRASFRDSYPQSLYFLDGRLAEAIVVANKKTKAFDPFLSGQTEEVDIEVKNVAIEDLRKPPYKAAVERQPVRRERYIANFVFVIKQPVANALVPFNPLGLTITYFREDQAFQ
jgi:type IV secretory pathway TrbF-like protein